MLLRSFSLLLLLITVSFSQNVYVKYRGFVNVDNGHFSKLSLTNSSLIKSMYYDEESKYLLVKLKNTYYHYCAVPNTVVKKWVDSTSLGKYYHSSIRGNYDCRVLPLPSY